MELSNLSAVLGKGKIKPFFAPEVNRMMMHILSHFC